MPKAATSDDLDFSINDDAPTHRRKSVKKPKSRAATKKRASLLLRMGGGSLRLLLRRPVKTLMIGAMGSMALLIAYNALGRQEHFHPAPLFSAAGSRANEAAVHTQAQPTAAPVPQPIARTAIKPTSDDRVANIPVPPATHPRPNRSAEAAAAAPTPIAAPVAVPTPTAAAAPRPLDPIAQLLNGSGSTAATNAAGAEPDAATVLVTQRNLIKMGYFLHADGVFGGTTRQAIEKFERDQNLPVRGDLTPALRRALALQAAMASQ